MPESIIADGNAVVSIYDAFGNRAVKAIPTATKYIGQIYECTNGECTKYIFSGARRIAQVKGADTFYYHTDHLGSATIITDSNGTNVEENYYYPFGELKSHAGSLDVRHKFSAHEYDAESGLYYMGARYYDAKLGRFISADTVVQFPFYPQSLNRYSVTLNNPIVLRELDGNCAFLSGNPTGSYSWAGTGTHPSQSGTGPSSYGSVSISFNPTLSYNPPPVQYHLNTPGINWNSSTTITPTTPSGVIGGGANVQNKSGTNLFLGQKFSFIPDIDPSGSSLLFNGKNSYWRNEKNEVEDIYPSISGPYGEGQLPEGLYEGDNLRSRTVEGMTCPDGGWSLNLTPKFDINRTDLRYHPDGGIIGTLGCIGVSCGSSGRLYNRLQNYFNSGHKSIPVEVRY